jgi:hypothetical protein
MSPSAFHPSLRITWGEGASCTWLGNLANSSSHESGRGKRKCQGPEAETHQVAITGEWVVSEVMWTGSYLGLQCMFLSYGGNLMWQKREIGIQDWCRLGQWPLLSWSSLHQQPKHALGILITSLSELLYKLSKNFMEFLPEGFIYLMLLINSYDTYNI